MNGIISLTETGPPVVVEEILNISPKGKMTIKGNSPRLKVMMVFKNTFLVSILHNYLVK